MREATARFEPDDCVASAIYKYMPYIKRAFRDFSAAGIIIISSVSIFSPLSVLFFSIFFSFFFRVPVRECVPENGWCGTGNREPGNREPGTQLLGFWNSWNVWLCKDIVEIFAGIIALCSLYKLTKETFALFLPHVHKAGERCCYLGVHGAVTQTCMCILYTHVRTQTHTRVHRYTHAQTRRQTRTHTNTSTQTY